MNTADRQNNRHAQDSSTSVFRLETMKTFLAGLMDEADTAKLMQCSPAVIEPIFNGATRMNPASLFLNTGSPEDMAYIRRQALNHNEEFSLATPGHTCHFDGPKDQGRDTANTKYLAYPDTHISSLQQKLEHRAGLVEVRMIMDDLMVNKEMIVSFISRGPIGSKVADPTLQITDSYYVIHSEYLLYRMLDPATFSREVETKGYLFVNYHTAGELTPEHVSAHLEYRRIYMDVERYHSYSANNQYAGNSIAPKKINHRFANMNNLRRHFGSRLDEHMFITGFDVDGETVYFAGAYPSGCGKTGTAMTGDALIGDDLAKIFIDKESGEVRAVNPEKGMFGIIEGVNRKDDPETMDVLEREGEEVIFSNLLIHDQKPYWQGCGYDLPDAGRNFTGEWTKDSGQPLSHKNARFTISLDTLTNYDSATENPEGVKLSALVFGGRDYTTMPTIVMAHDWMNTVVHGAIIRSATTATELGADGSEKRSPFANEAFFPGPLGEYIAHYKAFGENSAINEDCLPSGFQVNYWLHKSSRRELAPGEEDGLLGEKRDTKVWMRIMALMHQGKVETIWTPIGLIPKYRDLKQLFRELLDKDYSEEVYTYQFSLHIEKLIQRIDMSIEEFAKEQEMPEEFFHTLDTWRGDLRALESIVGSVVTPAQVIEYAAAHMEG
ncbi:MAG: phosphoenolpyruvate carboxykinase domain-containing protein [Candidatus Electrothrix aestuarii]|uniref:phosphoenolpyruvate carboxykinase (GTP) n=1 Tax=Candidatus Electrothrix aestuarii TaxID=3062594 RepID=A0AAU8LWY5_9BACT|nr:phosphoenolpyruvate carboxykinase domain-containing protein [Candidatus Electrothrix aestuarii]